jgi:hypothetical protein
MTSRFNDDPRKWGNIEAEKIRNDPDLSEAGRQRRLHEVHGRVRAELAERNAKIAADEEATLKAALRPILRPPGGHTAESRDLLAKMQRELRKPEQAQQAMRSATLSGDDLELWAAGAIAADMSASRMPGVAAAWRPILGEWAEHDPSRSHQLEALDDARSTTRNVTQRLIDGMTVPPAGMDEGRPPPPRENASDDLTPGAARQATRSDAWDRVSRQQSGQPRTIGGGFD